MNTPTPAPQRRRRRADAPEKQPPLHTPPDPRALPPKRRPPIEPDPREEVFQLSPARERPNTGKAAARRAAARQERMRMAVRALLIALCLIVFFACAFAITRDYLARQEERRRLEAEAAEKAQHPLRYTDQILYYAGIQELDPALVCAVILCESSFDPMAESRLGARGLMQLMEDTAQWVAHKLDEDDASYSFDLLYDPETNIRFGTWYLGYLSRRFGGDATKIVCAYHAGQGNVDSWLSNPAYSSDGVTLDVIPTEDTAAYAARVLRARDVYVKYYFPGPTPTPAAES